MQLYLPVAETSVSVLILIALGGGIGFLSGMFGVGGGFLMTPLLIFIGIPPAIAVGTGANQVVGASVSGLLAHWRRGNVDFRMGFVMLGGGVIGSAVGVWVFRLLREAGQVDLMISLTYVLLLGVVGALMVAESFRSIARSRKKPGQQRLHTHFWAHGWPVKVRFPKSKLYISVLPPAGIGFLAGVLASIMGVGGGFMLIPAMIYLLGMPTSVAVGTSLFQAIFVTSVATFLHAVTNYAVDVTLALILLVGAVIGAQVGTRVGANLKAEQLRALLGLMVLGVAFKVGYDLVVEPDDVFSVVPYIGP